MSEFSPQPDPMPADSYTLVTPSTPLEVYLEAEAHAKLVGHAEQFTSPEDQELRLGDIAARLLADKLNELYPDEQV